jgi:hypothetical protein
MDDESTPDTPSKAAVGTAVAVGVGEGLARDAMVRGGALLADRPGRRRDVR